VTRSMISFFVLPHMTIGIAAAAMDADSWYYS
jgi:hypothetical protein